MISKTEWAIPKYTFGILFGNRKISQEMEVSTNMSYPLEELISMLELRVSNIPELGHPPVDTTEGGDVRFWLCPELGDATSGPAPVSESGPKAGGFAAFLDFDLDPACTKVPSTTCTVLAATNAPPRTPPMICLSWLQSVTLIPSV